MSWLAAGIGAVSSLLGGNSARKSASADRREARQMDIRARNQFIADRKHSEKYERAVKVDDRNYVNQKILGDRRFQKDIRNNERVYERQQYDRTVADDRAYLEANRVRDQHALNLAEVKRVDSRGVDFQRLRDEAIAAGFNPLSVMGTAGMYSTEINQQIVGAGGLSGGVGTGRATPGSGGGGGGGGSYGGGGTTGAGTVGMVGPSPNVRNFEPSLSSGSFLADAVQRGVDTIFNQPAQKDPLADALRAALQTDTIVKDHSSKNIRQDFGYDLQAQAPYRPRVNVSGPPMSTGSSEQAAASSGSDDMVNPSSLPIKWGGRDFKPSGIYSDAESAEARYGEIAGEMLGMDSLIHDAANAAYGYVNKKGWFTRKPKLSQSARPRIRPGTAVPDGYGGYYW